LPTRVHIPNGISIGSAVQPFFLRRSPQNVPILYNELPISPSKLPHLHEESGPHHNTWFHGSTRNQTKRHLDRFSQFCSTHYCDRQTDRRTDHATASVTIGRIYVRSTAMRPNNNSNNPQTTRSQPQLRRPYKARTSVAQTNGGTDRRFRSLVYDNVIYYLNSVE